MNLFRGWKRSSVLINYDRTFVCFVSLSHLSYTTFSSFRQFSASENQRRRWNNGMCFNIRHQFWRRLYHRYHTVDQGQRLYRGTKRNVAFNDRLSSFESEVPRWPIETVFTFQTNRWGLAEKITLLLCDIQMSSSVWWCERDWRISRQSVLWRSLVLQDQIFMSCIIRYFFVEEQSRKIFRLVKCRRQHQMPENYSSSKLLIKWAQKLWFLFAIEPFAETILKLIISLVSQQLYQTLKSCFQFSRISSSSLQP